MERERPGPSVAPALALRSALREVFGSPGRRVAFVCCAAAVALLYTLLLPFDFTQRLELTNWSFLTPYQAIWSIVLGAGMGLVLVVQGYAMHRVARARAASGAVSGVAFVASLLPSFLCCTPFVPTVLAFVGLSGVSLYSTTGSVQHIFATDQTDFLAASLVLLAGTGWWGLRKVATAGCLSEDGCAPGAPDAPGGPAAAGLSGQAVDGDAGAAPPGGAARSAARGVVRVDVGDRRAPDDPSRARPGVNGEVRS